LQPGLEAPDYEYIVTPATGQLAQAAPQVLQQVRAIKVTLSFGTGQDRILQAIETSAPRPFIDHSYYAAIQSANSTAAAGSSAAAPTKLSNYYVLGGGTYVGSP
ncbi:MAG: hypothetical protein ACREQ5_14660, partial [Candidatus Dormibacteria bacterium]